MAFAALGASEVVGAHPEDAPALALLADAAGFLGNTSAGVPWPWPEPYLSYANAVLPEALMAIGCALGRQDLIDEGIGLLAWLLDHETNEGHLSVTPAGGCTAGDSKPGFDQQPIEVAALADACARAAILAPDGNWLSAVEGAVDWFLGDNDAGAIMWDSGTGGGYDGLTADGPNLNQGTESTLALVSTLQHGRRLARLRL
jgi:hypothetical protein